MKNHVVSVIMPVYNAEKYLKQSLDSVLSQTYKNIEVICINDGSKDSSPNILEQYEKRITVINQTNQGQCAASNTGIKAANGDYIKFFDADDIMNPEHIELQLKKINGRTDAIASCEWGRFYDENPASAIFKPEPVWKDMDSLDWLKKALSQKADMMGAPLWLIPKILLDKSGYWDERLSLNNDFEFSTKLLLTAKEVLFTPGAKLFYRSGLSGNLASTITENAYRAALLSTNLGCSYFLEKENSFLAKKLCANRYQTWAYRIYPNHKNLVKEIELKIKELGGSDIKIEGGKLFLILQKLLGWKFAKKLQNIFRSIRY